MTLREQYEQQGYLVLPEFIDENACDTLRTQIHTLIDGFSSDEHRSVFTTGNDRNLSDRYFLESGDKIRFFYEKDAFFSSGELTRPLDRCINPGRDV